MPLASEDEQGLTLAHETLHIEAFLGRLRGMYADAQRFGTAYRAEAAPRLHAVSRKMAQSEAFELVVRASHFREMAELLAHHLNEVDVEMAFSRQYPAQVQARTDYLIALYERDLEPEHYANTLYMSLASINVPMWNGTPKECGEVWTLRKGERVASCRLWTHPLGGEARLEVDGLWCRGETHREGLALMDAARLEGAVSREGLAMMTSDHGLSSKTDAELVDSIAGNTASRTPLREAALAEMQRRQVEATRAFNRASGRHTNIMIWLTVAIPLLTAAMLWLVYLQLKAAS